MPKIKTKKMKIMLDECERNSTKSNFFDLTLILALVTWFNRLGNHC